MQADVHRTPQAFDPLKHEVASFASTGRRMDEPLEDPQYFWVTIEGEPHEGEVERCRKIHVGATNEDEAREQVLIIQRQIATHYGVEPWSITAVVAATDKVDPDEG